MFGIWTAPQFGPCSLRNGILKLTVHCPPLLEFRQGFALLKGLRGSEKKEVRE